MWPPCLRPSTSHAPMRFVGLLAGDGMRLRPVEGDAAQLGDDLVESVDRRHDACGGDPVDHLCTGGKTHADGEHPFDDGVGGRGSHP